MTSEEIAKKFKFELELGIGRYKIKNTKNYKIAYFVLDNNEPYNLILELEKVLRKAGYRKLYNYTKHSNAIKITLNKGNYRIIEAPPVFDSEMTPRNRLPDFIYKILNKEDIIND